MLRNKNFYTFVPLNLHWSLRMDEVRQIDVGILMAFSIWEDDQLMCQPVTDH